jgi:hypothetical protein
MSNGEGETVGPDVEAVDGKGGGGFPDALRTLAGLIAVLGAVIVIAIIAGAAISKNTETASTIATATTGVIGSIVGAYLGMKIGGDRTKEANAAQREESAKAQVYALHVPDTNADDARKEAEAAAREVRRKAER